MTLVTVKLVPLEIVYVNSPSVVEAATVNLVKRMTSPVAILVFAIVCVPAVNTPVPMKLVTAPPFTSRVLAAEVIDK